MKTVTGLFDNHADARSAVTELEAAGVPSKDISIVSQTPIIETTANPRPLKVLERALVSAQLWVAQVVC